MDSTKRELMKAALPLIDLAIAEDIGPGDATSIATVSEDATLEARLIAKEAGVVAGLPIAEKVFGKVDPQIQFSPRVEDGDPVSDRDLVAQVTGPGRTMLSAERMALNFLQRLSGIATLTASFVEAVEGTEARILDTRKTHPGYRVLEKYAVRMGGGTNHRMGLFDMVLIKENHIEAAGSIPAAVARARDQFPHLPIEVEVKTLDELRATLALEVDRVMLDNMSVEQMGEAVDIAGGRVPLEASGNVTLDRVGAIAATGVDFISVGALTHSAPALDLSMLVL